jgi:hypothetical protein
MSIDPSMFDDVLRQRKIIGDLHVSPEFDVAADRENRIEFLARYLASQNLPLLQRHPSQTESAGNYVRLSGTVSSIKVFTGSSYPDPADHSAYAGGRASAAMASRPIVPSEIAAIGKVRASLIAISTGL